ncbi:calcium-activated chloride channel regulator 1-like [Ornithorhynchus anatinus]|uniref:calcium-activated chloride channel regulator 1-like n=1 Tax=Ornithorhynchus anatinus TaxID=9258 RepID=UPI0010A86D75|nr:calcium-activated chloride channel regulator 1-like [Ornithorhynchus anatinus]
MASNLFLVLAFSLLLQQGTTSMIHLNSNRYENLVIAINPDVPEDEKIIDKIKEMVSEASMYLFQATEKRFYFGNVSILIPTTWQSEASYLIPKLESYDKADVIVADPFVKYGDDPYTLQFGDCGTMGRYIHFTPNFFSDKSLDQYGPRGRVFVHEWAHFRWGVFDEYDMNNPFYFSSQKTIEATRCSIGIEGVARVIVNQGGSYIERLCRSDDQTGLYEAKCVFIPKQDQEEKSSLMFMQSLDSVVGFCNSKTHNTEAPNMQNKICKYRSTWDIIMNSTDFQNTSPMKEKPPLPTFSLLQARDRVVCLVLDKSQSMGGSNRLSRMNQAAEVFLLQIVEIGSSVGIVTFDTTAKIQHPLKQITVHDDRVTLTTKLPKKSSGGTSICSGVREGFAAIKRVMPNTYGSEIVLLTDGEDGKIGTCISEVIESGAIIHTIALGPSAAKELEKLSNLTGGLQFSATDKLDSNGLIDAFSKISSGSGNISQQSIQLESTGLKVSASQWLNGTVTIDSTVGNDTFFVVTWELKAPSIFLWDPKGKQYENNNFSMATDVKTARLQLPGTAEVGIWTYQLKNSESSPQVLTMTVTSRAANSNVPPVTVTAHMNNDKNDPSKPMVVYAEVSQGFLPVLQANVTAIIESEKGIVTNLQLLDNGAGADVFKNDGIYSRYFKVNNGDGRYSLKVQAKAKKSTAKLSLRRQQGHALYIPGYVKNGKVTVHPPRPEIPESELQAKLESFSRTASGGSFVATGTSVTQSFPPCRVSDLEAKMEDNHIRLSWTAPGDEYDEGRAKEYIIRISQNIADLRDQFDDAHQVNTTDLTPKDAHSLETYMFEPENITIENGTNIFIAIQTINQANLISDVSNIAQAAKFVPPKDIPPGSSNSGVSISTIVMAVVGSVVVICISVSATLCILNKKRH